MRNGCGFIAGLLLLDEHAVVQGQQQPHLHHTFFLAPVLQQQCPQGLRNSTPHMVRPAAPTSTQASVKESDQHLLAQKTCGMR